MASFPRCAGSGAIFTGAFVRVPSWHADDPVAGPKQRSAARRRCRGTTGRCTALGRAPSLGSCRRGGYYFGRRVTVKTGCGERGERGKCEEAASLAAGPTNPKRKRGADFHLAYASGWWGLVRILLVTNLEPQHEALRPVIGLLEQHAGEVLSGRRGAGDGEVRNL